MTACGPPPSSPGWSTATRRMVSDPPLSCRSRSAGGEGWASRRAAALRGYGRSLSGDRRRLLEQFRYVDMARKVVGVGSVGIPRVGRPPRRRGRRRSADAADQGGARVRAPALLRPHAYSNQGQRVVRAAADAGQLRHLPRLEPGPGTRRRHSRLLPAPALGLEGDLGLEAGTVATITIMAEICGWTLARAHARSGDRVAIAAYLGAGPAFDRAMADFASPTRTATSATSRPSPGPRRTARIEVSSEGMSPDRRAENAADRRPVRSRGSGPSGPRTRRR